MHSGNIRPKHIVIQTQYMMARYSEKQNKFSSVVILEIPFTVKGGHSVSLPMIFLELRGIRSDTNDFIHGKNSKK